MVAVAIVVVNSRPSNKYSGLKGPAGKITINIASDIQHKGCRPIYSIGSRVNGSEQSPLCVCPFVAKLVQ